MKHSIQLDEMEKQMYLYSAIEEAWNLTEEKRRLFYMNKEEQRLMNRRPRTKDRVLEYLSEKPGTAAQIADELGERRKTIGMCLQRLADCGFIARHAHGLYSVLGWKTRVHITSGAPSRKANAEDPLESERKMLAAFFKAAGDYCSGRSDMDPGTLEEFRVWWRGNHKRFAA
jgi:hypothetical protein